MFRIQSKKILILMLVVTLLIAFCGMAYAAGANDLVAKAEGAKDKVVKTIQDLAKVAAVVFIAWAGVIWWGAGGDAQKMAAAKAKLLWFFIALFFIFGAEGIANSLVGLFE